MRMPGPAQFFSLLYNGLWALFIACAVMAALIVVENAPRLPFLVENFQADSFDTILSIKWVHEYGIFGNIPHFTDGHRLFGSMPPLYALLGAFINAFINDASLSSTLLYWGIECSIFYLLWTRFLRGCDAKVKALLVFLFMVDILFGNMFPFGVRKRQQLAILIGMLMMLSDSLLIIIASSFAALLAQPFAGAAVIMLKASEMAEKKRFAELPALAIPFLLAFPFYSGLILSGNLQPQMLGTDSVLLHQYLLPSLLFAAAFAVFLFANRGKAGFLMVSTALLVSAFPLALLLFTVSKAILPFALSDAILHLVSIPSYENLFNAAALGIVTMIYLGGKGMRITEAFLFFLLLLNLYSLVSLSTFLTRPATFGESTAAVVDIIQNSNISQVKTLNLFMVDYPDRVHFTPVWTIFSLQGYALLHDRDLAFIDEVNMPPQLSKGGTNIQSAALPEAIYARDAEDCSVLVAGLRGRGVEGLVYAIGSDSALLGNDGHGPGAEGTFLNRSLLDDCGLEVLSDASYPNMLYVIYRVK